MNKKEGAFARELYLFHSFCFLIFKPIFPVYTARQSACARLNIVIAYLPFVCSLAEKNGITGRGR
jgi:hypothetical protein